MRPVRCNGDDFRRTNLRLKRAVGCFTLEESGRHCRSDLGRLSPGLGARSPPEDQTSRTTILQRGGTADAILLEVRPVAGLVSPASSAPEGRYSASRGDP